MPYKKREDYNAYRREWARKNPDKIRAQQARYWLKMMKRIEKEKRQDAKTQETE